MPTAIIVPEISDDGYDIIGYVAIADGAVVARGATKRAAAEAAEAAGFDPWMTDAEAAEAAEALDHGNWL